MREEGSPLDLNILPEDFGERCREGKQALQEGSTASAETSDSSRHRKKKGGGKEGKDENEKVYECRFCSLKFCKSQALGGHMNRHRQERETETLNRARQLVFSNESLATQGPLSHLGCSPQALPSGSFHQRAIMADPSLPLRTVYTRLPSPSSTSILSSPPPPQPYIYPTSSRYLSFPSSYPAPVTDYFIGHVVPSNHQGPNYAAAESNYTCMGAPIGHGFTAEGVRASVPAGGREGVSHARFTAGSLNSSSYTEEQGLDPPINRFREDY